MKAQRRNTLRSFDLKVEALEHYNPTGRCSCSYCGESFVPALTLSHLAPTPQFPQHGHNLYYALKKAGYPELPIITECMNCNVSRDNYGRGYKEL